MARILNFSRDIVRLAFSCLLSLFLVTVSNPVYAQSEKNQPKETLYKASVQRILDSGTVSEYGFTNPYQKVSLKILNGDLNGEDIVVEHGKGYIVDSNQLVSPGQTVIVSAVRTGNNTVSYQIADAYRLDQVIWLVLIFFTGIIILSGWRGIGAIAGMLVSLAIIVLYIVPQLLAGKDPLGTSVIGCFFIMVLTIYLAHGISKQTTIALISTCITLIGTGILATISVQIAHLSGIGNEDALSLKLGPTSIINLRGLLLGGILIGTLGVLDDVTTGLTASIFELSQANKRLTFRQLHSAGLKIGKEHITSLVNTLVLAYAGASLPVFLTILVNPNHVPLWFILNSEIIMEEVIRTLSGSIGLVAAVPLTTYLASYYIVSSRDWHRKNPS